MKIVVIGKQDTDVDGIMQEYKNVIDVHDVITERGLLAHQLQLEDGRTATFNKIDWKVYKVGLIEI